MEDIKIVRFKNGEDVIGYVLQIDDTEIGIKDPLRIDILPNYKLGKSSIVMQSWLPYQITNHNEVNIHMENILFIYEPTEAFVEYYMEMVDKLQKISSLNNILEVINSMKDDLSEEDELIEAMFEKDSSMVH